MSTVSKPFYAAACDYPGCGRIEDGGEHTFWSEPEHAIEMALDSGEWLQEEDAAPELERRLFCDQHREHVRWPADEDDNADDGRVITLPDGEAVKVA